MKFLRASALAAGLVLLAGCSGSGGQPTTEKAITAAPAPAGVHPRGTSVQIMIGTDTVDPAGSLVPVRKGSPVTLVITAVAAGELHVHSTPEQHIDYPRGVSTATLTFTQPGVVDVESHALNKLIVQLEDR